MAPNARRFSGWFLIHITEVLEVKELDPIHNCCSPHQKKKRKLTLIYKGIVCKKNLRTGQITVYKTAG
jgi:hypothetical protein